MSLDSTLNGISRNAHLGGENRNNQFLGNYERCGLVASCR